MTSIKHLEKAEKFLQDAAQHANNNRFDSARINISLAGMHLRLAGARKNALVDA